MSLYHLVGQTLQRASPVSSEKGFEYIIISLRLRSFNSHSSWVERAFQVWCPVYKNLLLLTIKLYRKYNIDEMMCDVMRTLHADLFWGAGCSMQNIVLCTTLIAFLPSSYFTPRHTVNSCTWLWSGFNMHFIFCFHSWLWAQTHWFKWWFAIRKTSPFEWSKYVAIFQIIVWRKQNIIRLSLRVESD